MLTTIEAALLAGNVFRNVKSVGALSGSLK